MERWYPAPADGSPLEKHAFKTPPGRGPRLGSASTGKGVAAEAYCLRSTANSLVGHS
jgi:hypothetical protein